MADTWAEIIASLTLLCNQYNCEDIWAVIVAAFPCEARCVERVTAHLASPVAVEKPHSDKRCELNRSLEHFLISWSEYASPRESSRRRGIRQCKGRPRPWTTGGLVPPV